MLTAVPPINPKAAKAATQSVAAKNPELVNPDGSIKPIDPASPQGAAARKQWMQNYVAHGGKARITHPPHRAAQVKKAQTAAGKLPDKPPAAAVEACPVVVTGGGAGRRAELRAAPAPPPVAKASDPCKPGEMTCQALQPQLQCSHHGGRRPSAANLLEVVPAESGDTINLACKASGCGKPPVWSISGHTSSEKTGTSTSFNAERWLIRAIMGAHWAATATPKTYRVHAATECGAQTAAYTVRAFPSDKFSISINGKEWAQMKSKLDYALDVVLGAYLVDPSFEFLVGKLEVSAGWEEDKGSHLAFYAWKATVSFDPLIGGKVRIPFGPLAAIPQWLKKFGDAYFFVEFSGGVGIVGEWGRTGPSELSGSVKATGKISGKIGGSMFFVSKSVIVMEVAGASGITFEAEPDMNSYDYPACVVGGEWDGLKAEVTVVTVRGIVEFKREFQVCDKRELMVKRPYELPVWG